MDPGEYALVAAVTGAARGCRGPDRQETAVIQGHDLGRILSARDFLVDLEAAALGGAGIVEHLAIDPLARPVAPVGFGPEHHEGPVGQRRDTRLELIARRDVVGLELDPDRITAFGEDLPEDAALERSRNILGLRCPDDDVGAVAQGRHPRALLIVQGEGVDLFVHGVGQDAAVVHDRQGGLHQRRGGAIGNGQAQQRIDEARPGAEADRHRLGQRLDAFCGGRCIQIDAQRGPAGTGFRGIDRTDGRSLIGDGGAVKADLTGACPRIVDRKLQALHEGGHVLHLDKATVEAGPGKVVDVDIGVDPLRRGQQGGLGDRVEPGALFIFPATEIGDLNAGVRDRTGPDQIDIDGIRLCLPTVAIGDDHADGFVVELDIGGGPRRAIAGLFEDRLDVGRGGIGVEGDGQTGAIRTVERCVDRADGGAVDADRAAGQGDITACHDAQLIGRIHVAAGVVQLERAAIEIGTGAVRKGNRLIQPDGVAAGDVIGARLNEAVEIAQFGRDVRSRRGGEFPQEDTVARPVAGRGRRGRGIGDEDIAIGPSDQRAVFLARTCLLVDEHLLVGLDAIRVEGCQDDAKGTAVGHIGGETDRKAAIGRRGQVEIELAVQRLGVQAEFAALRRAGRVIELREDALGAAVKIAVFPDDNEPATGQADDLARRLAVCRGGIHKHIRSGRHTGGIIDPHEHAVGIAVALAATCRRGEDHHMSGRIGAVGEEGHLALALVAGRIGSVDHLFGAHRRTGGVKALAEDRVTRSVAAVGCVGDDIAAIGGHGDGRIELGAGYRGVDDDLAAHRRPGGIELLCDDAEIVIGAVVLILAFPDDDEPAIGGRRHFRVSLRGGGRGVGQPFGARRHAAGIVHLEIDAFGEAIRVILDARAPDNDKSAAGELDDVRIDLVILRVGVDPAFVLRGQQAVALGRDCQGDELRRRAEAVAVGQLDPHGPVGHRRIGRGRIPHRADHCLDILDRGGSIEHDLQRRAARAVLGDGSDHGAVDRDRGAGHLHIAVADIAADQAEHILGLTVVTHLLLRHVLGQIDRDQQHPAVKPACPGVPHRNRLVEIERHKTKIGIRLVNSPVQIGPLHHRPLPQIEVRRIAEYLLEHAVAAAITRGAAGDRGEADNVVAPWQRGDCRLRLIAAGFGVHEGLAVEPRPAGVIGLDVNGIGTAIGIPVVAEGDDKAAIRSHRNLRFALGVGNNLVDDEGPVDRRGRIVEPLRDDGLPAAVLGGIVFPDDDETAAGHGRDGRVVLGIGG